MEVEKAYKIAAVGGQPLALGLKMAGVTESHVVDQPQEAEQIIKGLLERNDIGIIVVSSRLVNGITDRKLRDAIATSTLPLFMQVADFNEDMKSENDELRQLVVRALGIDIKNI